ncbi:EAL domain-containing protein [Neobacillus notoginsengisoli]|uniref:EAL domain-containing protein n=1 Tax=Neobacillus notoginsengisoli TaxID=1578198 RepID=A0A417YY83_9BACI|nr:GGDEF and EAL domain-containing protein [Neobacillus notoginsengisoli]RHW42742.1 EAL domain-containing protein [Neobacillus notoginsengisoli]
METIKKGHGEEANEVTSLGDSSFHELHDRNTMFKNICEALNVGIWSFDLHKQDFLFISKGVENISGYTAEEIKLISWQSIIHPDDLVSYKSLEPKILNGNKHYHQYRIIHKSGETRWIGGHMIPITGTYGNVVRMDGTISDITQQILHEEQITRLAFHDHLTGVANRRMFDEKIAHLCKSFAKREPRHNETFSILYIDLDRFKNINSSLGRSVADQLLRNFASRIEKVLNESSLLARISGDEFGIILWNTEGLEESTELAEKIIEITQHPFFIGAFELYITTSIGISTYPNDGDNVETLVKNASAARYQAKERGKNGYHHYTSSMNIASYKLFMIERDLRSGIKDKELYLHYQPRVDAKTGKMISAEALIRWEHPIWGLISPGEFIPVAEQSDLILHIGEFVIDKACQTLSDWKRKGLPIVPISINISAKRFLKTDWINKLQITLDDYQLDPSFLEIEITETALIMHTEAVNTSLKLLKDIGIRVALDDFGTGYSSLTYLKQFPVDTLKIDRSFIKNLSESAQDQLITKSIITLAHGLNMRVVAEGVEEVDQLTFLQELNCDEIQGYLFSKPVSGREFEVLLQKQVLKPTKPPNKFGSFSDRSEFDLVTLPRPLSAIMSLKSLHGKEVNVGNSEVSIQTIGQKSLSFISGINLPARPELLLQLKTTIAGEPINLSGIISWKKEQHDHFQYELTYKTDDENQTDHLHKLLRLGTVPALHSGPE